MSLALWLLSVATKHWTTFAWLLLKYVAGVFRLELHRMLSAVAVLVALSYSVAEFPWLCLAVWLGMVWLLMPLHYRGNVITPSGPPAATAKKQIYTRRCAYPPPPTTPIHRGRGGGEILADLLYGQTKLWPNRELYLKGNEISPGNCKQIFLFSLTVSIGIYYASPTSGEAYRDRRLTTNFELWVEIFCVSTCFHMRNPKPCLSVPPSVCPSVCLSAPREKKSS